MKVLVTGSAGFIGGCVAAELALRGHEAVPFDKPDCDVRDPAAIEAACTSSQAEAIIHLAAMLGTPELLGSEAAAAGVNVLGAVNVYDAAARMGLPVVQIGTGHKGQPNPYAITKGCAEELGLARAQWLGEKIAVVRAYNAYGPHQKPPPPWGHSPVQKFFPTFACQALKGVPLELYGGGGQLIDPVHVTDVAAVLVAAIGGPYGEVTDAGNGKPVTVREVAAGVLAACGETGAVLTEMPGRPGEPPGAEVVAANPACHNPWPYLVTDTVGWYREWLSRSSR